MPRPRSTSSTISSAAPTPGASEIDALIAERLAEGWSLERLDRPMRAILRAGAYELVARPDVPVATVITEYVDVAHAFYDKRETGFVNGLLDAIAKAARPARADEWRARGDRAAAAHRHRPGGARAGWTMRRCSTGCVITHDTIAEGVHFLPFDPPASVGWKLVAVNLSDLAAKGATPRAALLSHDHRRCRLGRGIPRRHRGGLRELRPRR